MTHAQLSTPPMRGARLAAACLLALLALACRGESGGAGDTTALRPPAFPLGGTPTAGTNADATPPAVPFDPSTPRVAAVPVASWPHDTAAFTQGLLVDRGRLLESTGLEGKSDVREVDRRTGRVLRRTELPSSEFGEGIAVVGRRVYQLTWRAGRGHVYDDVSLAPVDSFAYQGEGWGLTSDGRQLYMSDGSSKLRVVDPHGFRTLRTIQVSEGGQTVWMLNELEWVRGELWANVYRTNFIARIDPETGRILGWIDVGDLLTPAERRDVAERGGVANGIAYDSTRGRVLLTGKKWPRLFEIDVRAFGTGPHPPQGAP